MARPIVLSNGSLHVGLNKYGTVHDFYYPYVGLENHSAGKSLRHRVGVWVEGRISWLDNEGEWQFQFRYPHQALIGHTIAKNEDLGVSLEFDDFVDAEDSIFIRNIHIVNHRDIERDIRLFMHQAFAIGDSRSNTDTAQYLPDSNAIVHYRGRRVFVVGGQQGGDGDPFDQYTVGLFGIEGREGSYRDADDGELSGCNVEHGRVDSAIRFQLLLPAQSSGRVQYWIAAGTSLRGALTAHKDVQERGTHNFFERTVGWWHTWLEPTIRAAEQLPENLQDSFVRSAMIVKSQIDKRGAVMASTDTTMLNYSRDAYAYCWPRDGAYVIWPLIRMGYIDEPLRFFKFCREGLHNDGYLMHKYRADGALGSSWHPYVHDDVVAPPIQEDETALVLFMFGQFYQAQNDTTILADFYDSMVKPMANFLQSYIDETTGLPKPSYDLWEEVFQTTTYTTAVVYSALNVAAELASTIGDAQSAVTWKGAADNIRTAAQKTLYNPERKAFYKGIVVKDGVVEPDQTIDLSSFFGAYAFGLFDVSSPDVAQALETIRERFAANGVITGLPRYENDWYQRADADTPPNNWFICTLWVAQYYLEKDQTDEALKLIEWTQQHMSSTSIMSEQIHPISEERLSVEPLTWSHAEYLSTLLDVIQSHSEA